MPGVSGSSQQEGSTYKTGSQETEILKKPSLSETIFQESSQQKMEPSSSDPTLKEGSFLESPKSTGIAEKSSDSEASSNKSSPPKSESSRPPRSCSEETIPYVTSEQCPSVQKQGTTNEEVITPYDTCPSSPDLEFKDPEAESISCIKCGLRSSEESLLDSLVDVVATTVSLVEKIEASVEEGLAIASTLVPKASPTRPFRHSGDSDEAGSICRVASMLEEIEFSVDDEVVQSLLEGIEGSFPGLNISDVEIVLESAENPPVASGSSQVPQISISYLRQVLEKVETQLSESTSAQESKISAEVKKLVGSLVSKLKEQETNEPMEVVTIADEQTVGKETRETAQGVSSVVSEEERSEEENPPGSGILNIASRVVHEEQSPSASVQEIVSKSFVSVCSHCSINTV